MRIVMLGKLRSGKTTIASLITEAVREVYGIELYNKPLAGPIYAEARNFYQKYGLTWRKNRKLLEAIGEAFNGDYPAGDLIVELYEKNINPEGHFIVEDCRRLTQTDMFNKYGVIYVRVNATDEVRKSRCLPGEWSEGAITDTELENYPSNFSIDNNGNDMIELKQKVLAIVKEFQSEDIKKEA